MSNSMYCAQYKKTKRARYGNLKEIQIFTGAECFSVMETLGFTITEFRSNDAMQSHRLEKE